MWERWVRVPKFCTNVLSWLLACRSCYKLKISFSRKLVLQLPEKRINLRDPSFFTQSGYAAEVVRHCLASAKPEANFQIHQRRGEEKRKKSKCHAVTPPGQKRPYSALSPPLCFGQHLQAAYLPHARRFTDVCHHQRHSKQCLWHKEYVRPSFLYCSKCNSI